MRPSSQNWYVLLKSKILIFGYNFFYYVIDTVYIYSWLKFNKILTHFGDATYEE